MRANEDGRGWFANPAGGGRHWLEFLTVFDDAIRFPGRVINAGFVYHKLPILKALGSKSVAAGVLATPKPTEGGRLQTLEQPTRLPPQTDISAGGFERSREQERSL